MISRQCLAECSWVAAAGAALVGLSIAGAAAAADVAPRWLGPISWLT
jgi:hypothetical protein